MDENKIIKFEDLPDLLSPEELQKYLRIGRTTTYELLRSGSIPHKRFGRTIRIPKQVLGLESEK